MRNPWFAMADQAEIDRFVAIALDHYKQTSGQNYATVHEVVGADELEGTRKEQNGPNVRLLIHFAHPDDNKLVQCRYHMFGDGKIDSHDIPYGSRLYNKDE